MPQLRLALAQVDTTVGDLHGNAECARAAVARAAAGGAHLVAFPEMYLSGYPVEDLALRPAFVETSRAVVEKLAADLAADGFGDVAVLIGYLDREVDAVGGNINRLGRPALATQNCAAVLHGGRVVGRYAKNHLPNYGVFDDQRIFTPGLHGQRLFHRGVDIAVLVCEDLWRDGGVTAQLAAAHDKPGVIVVLNASPYERGKERERYELCRGRALETGCVVAYVNSVGGQDELVYDGDSMVVDATGRLVARAPQFAEDVVLVDVEAPTGADEAGPGRLYDRAIGTREPVPAYDPQPGRLAEPREPLAELHAALVLALGDYARKNGFTDVVLGLSGGIDSAVVASLACDALGAAHVHTVAMPSELSSEHSTADAAELARRTGTRHRVVPVQPMVDAFLATFADAGSPLSGVAAENVQSRVRGVALMAINNAEGHLVLATGNKSELATGYSTIYGDAVGGFAPLKDVPKTVVWELARWRNAEAERRGETPPIPENSIAKPPSAELAPGQLDSDALPDYATVDAIVEGYVVRDQPPASLVAAGLDPDEVTAVTRLVDRAEWKRRQYPPGTKVSPKAFGRDRRMPVTNRWWDDRAQHG